jgi:hypothetical protein
MGAFERFRRFATWWLNGVGSSLPWLIIVLIELSLLALFFMYLWCFLVEARHSTGRGTGILLILIVVAGLVSLVSMVAMLFSRNVAGEGSPAVRQQSLWPYLALIVLPLVVILIVNHWFGVTFQSGLLKQTQDELNRALF